MATWQAIQCVDETTPNVPIISGRVVNFWMPAPPRLVIVSPADDQFATNFSQAPTFSNLL
jgi:hypothetical protein